MRYKAKFLSGTLVLLLLLSLAGCGTAQNEEITNVSSTFEPVVITAPPEATSTPEPTPTPDPTPTPTPAPENLLSEEEMLSYAMFRDLYVRQQEEAIEFPSNPGSQSEVYDPLGFLDAVIIEEENSIFKMYFDASNVDVTTPGAYDLTYIVSVNVRTGPNQAMITKTVYVVSPEDYEELTSSLSAVEVTDGTAWAIIVDLSQFDETEEEPASAVAGEETEPETEVQED